MRKNVFYRKWFLKAHADTHKQKKVECNENFLDLKGTAKVKEITLGEGARNNRTAGSQPSGMSKVTLVKRNVRIIDVLVEEQKNYVIQSTVLYCL